MNDYRESFSVALLEVDRLSAVEIASTVINNQGLDYFLHEIFIPVLDDVGVYWEHDTISLSQVYMSGRICEEIVNEFFDESEREPINTKRIGIVSFNTNQTLGKTIATSLLKGYGYNIIDYGYGVDIDALINFILRDKIEIILISVLMLPAALKIREFVEKLNEISPETKVLVGGAPFRFDKNLWKEVNADAMGESIADDHQVLLDWMEE